MYIYLYSEGILSIVFVPVIQYWTNTCEYVCLTITSNSFYVIGTVKVVISMQRNRKKVGFGWNPTVIWSMCCCRAQICHPSHHMAVVGNSPENQPGASRACGISKLCNELDGSGVCLSFPLWYLCLLSFILLFAWPLILSVFWCSAVTSSSWAYSVLKFASWNRSLITEQMCCLHSACFAFISVLHFEFGFLAH